MGNLEGIIHVLTTTLNQVPAGTNASVATTVDGYFGATAPVDQHDPAMAERYQAGTRGLGCIRGLRYAIAAEAGAALMLYGLWHLWHVLIR